MAGRGNRPKREAKKPKSSKRSANLLTVSAVVPSEPVRVPRKKRKRQQAGEEVGA